MRKSPIAVLALLVPFLASCEEEPPPEIVRPVRAMQVVGAEAFQVNRFPGKARATRRTNVSFEVPGRMLQRPVDVGTEVKRGDLLAALDQRDFTNALEQAKAVAQRETLLVERLRQAYESGAVPLQQVNDAEARLRASEAEVRIRQKDLEDTSLLAPHDGKISATYVEAFEQIQAKQPIMRLLDTSRIEMIVNVPENVISYAPYVVEMMVRFDSYPDNPIPAEFLEISNEASEATRTYPVTVIMDQPEDFEIQPGMAGEMVGKAVLPGDEGRTEFEIPITSVFSPDDTQQSFVWVIDQETKTVSRRAVQVGTLTDFGVKITDGLNDGEWIATAGVFALSEGLEVKILDFSNVRERIATEQTAVPQPAGQQVEVPATPAQTGGEVTSPFTGGKEE